MDRRRQIVIGLVGCVVWTAGFAWGQPPQGHNERGPFDKLFADGNFKDAYDVTAAWRSIQRPSPIGWERS